MAGDLFVDSDGVRLAVRDYGGSGAPVILVHGHYGNLGQFDYLGPLLSEHVRAVAYDQRGHGWSDSGPTSVTAYANDLAAVIAALGLQMPTLYGSSWGTLVCLGYFREGGQARGFISEDGRVADFQQITPRPQPPSIARRILSRKEWEAVRLSFAAAGPTGEATAERSRVRRTDGRVELRPSAEDLFSKETAVVAMPIVEAYKHAPKVKLFLAAEHVPDIAHRRSDIAALRSMTSIDIQWFATGHWISAEDTEGVAQAVVEFIQRV